MAFNPFHAFRKYSKSMFAVLAIVCMLTFVLSSGLGGKNDFFTNIGDNFGAGGSKYPEVARLDGKKIDARMIQDTSYRRKLADIYMTNFAAAAKMRVIDHAETRTKGAAPFISKGIENILSEMRYATNPQYFPRAYGSSSGGGQIRPDQALQQHIMLLGVYIDSLNRDKKTEEADALIKVRAVLNRDLLRLNLPPTYFGASTRTEDLLDFMVWKRVADKQDIKLSSETVIKLIEAEALGEDVKDLMSEVDTFMRRQPDFKDMKIATVLDAIDDEFRVRIAQETLLGEGPQRDNVPAYVTPYEFRKYYDDQRRAVKVDLLPVKVDDYLAQVKETPTDAELKELFDKYKKDEWSPQSDYPGFKEPKRVKIEWISGKFDTPYFRLLGADTAKKSAAIVGALGGGALATKNPADPDGRLEREYQIYKSKNKFRGWMFPANYLPVSDVHQNSVVRPEIYAATVASALAAKGSGSVFFAPATTLAEQALLQEMRDRTRFGMQFWSLVGAPPATFLGLSDAWMPQPLPLKVVAGQLSEEIKVELARNQFTIEFNKLEEDIKKKAKEIKKPETKAEIEKLVAEFVKKHGLTRGASTEPRDLYSLVNDPGLKPLKDHFYKDSHNAADKLGMRFALQYFYDLMGGMTPKTDSPLYQPQWFQMVPPGFSPDESTYFLTWKTEEAEAKTPKKLDEVKDKVIAAWKRLKAQKLAADAANALQKEVRDKAIRDKAVLLDFALEHKTDVIELDPLAKLNKSRPNFQAGMPPSFQGPNIPEDKVEFASEAMTNAIVELRDKPKGEAIVVSDRPKARYYVAVLLDVQEPSDVEFRDAYARGASGSMFGASDSLLRRLELERREKYRTDLMAQLRTEWKLEIKEGAKKLADTGGEE